MGEATEEVGEAADSLEAEWYEEEGDIDDDIGEPGDPGLKGPSDWLLLNFSFLGLRCLTELLVVVVPTLDVGDCGELGPEFVSAPDDVDTDDTVPLPAALGSSSSSGISLAWPLMCASISFLLLNVSSHMVHL